MSKIRQLFAVALVIGLTAAVGFAVDSPKSANVAEVTTSSVSNTSVSPDAELLNDWEFTRGGRGGRCRFGSPSPFGSPMFP